MSIKRVGIGENYYIVFVDSEGTRVIECTENNDEVDKLFCINNNYHYTRREANRKMIAINQIFASKI